jgi:Icc-related predicted phosphoesterase
MRLLVLGDLHLGEDGFEARPHPSWERFDAVLTVGDVAHSSVAFVDGRPRRDELVGFEEARAFLRRLDDLGVPVRAVPGNHDHGRHADLVDGTTRIRSLHRTTSELEGYRAFGFGSETFDDGPTVRYDPEAVPEDDPDAWLAETLERAVRDGTAPEALRERIDEFDRQFDAYADRYGTLRSLVPDSGTAIGVVHVPPFDTTLDRIADEVPRIGGRHWGSIALTNLLATRDVSFLACGHIHEGEGTATVAGTVCLNAGYRSAYEVTLEGDDVSVADAEGPIGIE